MKLLFRLLQWTAVGVEEIDNVLAMASALGLDEAQAVLLFADLVREEPDLELAY